MNRSPVGDPSPSEILAKCTQIRASWSNAECYRRYIGVDGAQSLLALMLIGKTLRPYIGRIEKALAS